MSESTTERTERTMTGSLSNAGSKSCDRLFMFTVPQRVHVDPAGNQGLGRLLQYVNHHPKARLRAMSAPDVLGGDQNERWDAPVDTGRLRSMGGRYMISVESTNDSRELEAALRSDDRVSDLNRPNAYRKTVSLERRVPTPVGIVELSAADKVAIKDATNVVQWGLHKCRFPEVWAELDTPFDPAALRTSHPKPIGMIDIGNHLGHPELEGRVTYFPGMDPTTDSIADHAGAVAGIMVAQRGGGGVGGEDMDGCCSARVEVYNVWSRNEGLDQGALYEALRTVINKGLPVVNMSIWLDEHDPELSSLIEECEDKNVVVVAAIGNLGTDTKLWPAAYDKVVAVVATDPTDRRHKHSSYGDHATVAAPGENILTVYGNSAYDRMSGTSFAAPFVTAAVWLAKNKRPDLTNEQVRKLLRDSTVQAQGEEMTNCGRLDMTKLGEELAKIPLPGNRT
jgi:subtilisin family serine protease